MQSPTDFWGHHQYVLSPTKDWFWIILSPVWAIIVGWVMSRWLFDKTVTIFDTTETAAFFFYMSLTQAHLFITAFRTHANSTVFEQYYWRFTLVPLVLLFAAINSDWAFAIIFAVVVFWDVYHSSMQIFGLGRIYDRKAGNDPATGRSADYLLCLVMYAGPIISGVLLTSHLAAMDDFANLSDIGFWGVSISGSAIASSSSLILEHQESLSRYVIAASLLITAIYVVLLLKARNRGYKISLPKMAMFASTIIGCIFAWGFNSFAMGYLIANLFHAVQYFALVWGLEDSSVKRVLGRQPYFRLALFITIPLSLGLLSVSLDSVVARAILLICALMHFWWDGFIWSVRDNNGMNIKTSATIAN
jgi:hypothetical protein